MCLYACVCVCSMWERVHVSMQVCIFVSFSALLCVYIHLPVRRIKRCAQVHSTHPYSHMWNPEVLITLHFNFWSLIEPGAHLFSQRAPPLRTYQFQHAALGLLILAIIP